MKWNFNVRGRILLLVLLATMLAACERPLRSVQQAPTSPADTSAQVDTTEDTTDSAADAGAEAEVDTSAEDDVAAADTGGSTDAADDSEASEEADTAEEANAEAEMDDASEEDAAGEESTAGEADEGDAGDEDTGAEEADMTEEGEDESPRPDDSAAEEDAAETVEEEAQTSDEAADTGESTEGEDAAGSADAADTTEADTTTESDADADAGADEETSGDSEEDADAAADSDAETSEDATTDATSEEEMAAEEQTHVVAAGESLYQIGLQYGVSWVTLAEYNELANANDIKAGQELRIPPADGADTPSETEDTDESTDAAGGQEEMEEVSYLVQPGDTLYTIGLRYGVSWVQIAEANGIVNPNQIFWGQTLKIPVESPGPQPEFTHTVQPGETLFLISVRYGVPWPTIAAANDIAPPYLIYTGEVLAIPGGQ